MLHWSCHCKSLLGTQVEPPLQSPESGRLRIRTAPVQAWPTWAPFGPGSARFLPNLGDRARPNFARSRSTRQRVQSSRGRCRPYLTGLRLKLGRVRPVSGDADGTLDFGQFWTMLTKCGPTSIKSGRLCRIQQARLHPCRSYGDQGSIQAWPPELPAGRLFSRAPPTLTPSTGPTVFDPTDSGRQTDEHPWSDDPFVRGRAYPKVGSLVEYGPLGRINKSLEISPHLVEVGASLVECGPNSIERRPP